MESRKIAIFRSLNRQNLIFGCERELLLILALFCSALVFVGQSLVTLFLGLIIWTLSLFFLRRMAKADPYMSKIFARHVRQQGFYARRSRPWRRR